MDLLDKIYNYESKIKILKDIIALDKEKFKK